MPLFGPPNVEKLRRKGNVKGLIKGLDYKDSDVRLRSARALGQIGDARAVKPLIAALRQWTPPGRSDFRKALEQIGSPAVEPLITKLKDENEYIRTQATWALGVIGDPRAVKPLIAALKDENEYIRTQVTWALGDIGDPRAVKPLIAALEDSDYCTGAEARALGDIGDASAIEPLVAILKNGNSFTCQTAAKALVQIGSISVEPLIAALKSGDEFTRDGAIWALEKIDDPQAKDALAAFNKGRKSYQEDGQLASYRLRKTNLGNLWSLEVKTEKLCVYCKDLRFPNMRDSNYPKGVGECNNYQGKGIVSLDESCEQWRPNTMVRFWLSKGYVQDNRSGWPRKIWYQVFDDGPDGEKGAH